MAPPRSYDGVGLPGAARGMDAVFSSGPSAASPWPGHCRWSRARDNELAGRWPRLGPVTGRPLGPSDSPMATAQPSRVHRRGPRGRQCVVVRCGVAPSTRLGSWRSEAGAVDVRHGLPRRGPCCPGSGRGPTLGACGTAWRGGGAPASARGARQDRGAQPRSVGHVGSLEVAHGVRRRNFFPLTTTTRTYFLWRSLQPKKKTLFLWCSR